MDNVLRDTPRLLELLRLLEVDQVDRDAILLWREELTGADGERIDELAERLRAGIGDWFGVWDREVFSGDAGLDSRLGDNVLPLFALLATAPDVHAAHLRRGVPAELSWHALSDLGQQLRVCRRVHGVPSLATGPWLANAWSDGFAWLGRLQFELTRSPDGETVYGVHIPDTGPLLPDEVDAAFARAAHFFPEHYPEVRPLPRFFECDSWLLDPQVAAVVPGSNMALFQQRWDIVESAESDRSGLFFGFGIEPPRPGVTSDPAFLDTLPTGSRLHRGLVGIWRAGGHVMGCRGRLPLERLGLGPGQ
ncbi:MAG TPA: acyltransferase domain-containing protein [Propionibacteriaceae bacterium]|nr:acyltransferase domain-containing protein [Propionibacteriaceae bacterium]